MNIHSCIPYTYCDVPSNQKYFSGPLCVGDPRFKKNETLLTINGNESIEGNLCVTQHISACGIDALKELYVGRWACENDISMIVKGRANFDDGLTSYGTIRAPAIIIEPEDINDVISQPYDVTNIITHLIREVNELKTRIEHIEGNP
jgi:hypothetical protein